MSNGGRPRTRQELYDRIRESSKETVILEDMVRLGFWPVASNIPGDPANEVHRIAELQRQIAAARTEAARLQNVEHLKREMRKRRLEESKQKQHETKLRHERERLARAEAWRLTKTRAITYLGAGVSGGLTKGAPAEPTKLTANGLPWLESAGALATAMGITIGELRFLTYSRRTSQKTHYVRFQIPKKTGGTRLISAPMPRLKRAQRWLLDNILAKVPLHDAAHGFVPDRSILTNALPHVGKTLVLNLDLKDFFPTFTYRRVKGVIRALGYGDEIATILSLLMTEPEVDEVELDGLSYFVARGPRKLPQGSPASPALTNIACRRLDKRLTGMAKSAGFSYSRYADDLTFSASTPEAAANAGRLMQRIRYVLHAEGLAPHEKKTRLLRRGGRQEVTGVVVNDKPAIARDTLRRFRALLFQLEKDGPAGKRWGDREGESVFASAIGFASYVAMIDPDHGRPLLVRARAIAEKHRWQPPPRRVFKAPIAPPPPAPAAAPPPPPPPPVAPSLPPSAGPRPAPFQPPAPPPEPEPPPPPPKKKWWQIF